MERRLEIEREEEAVERRAHRLSVRRDARAPVVSEQSKHVRAQPLVARAPPAVLRPALPSSSMPPSGDVAVMKRRRIGSVDFGNRHPLALVHLCPPRRSPTRDADELNLVEAEDGPARLVSGPTNVGTRSASPVPEGQGVPCPDLRGAGSSSLPVPSGDGPRRFLPTFSTCGDVSSDSDSGTSSIDLPIRSRRRHAVDASGRPAPAPAEVNVSQAVSPETSFGTREERQRTRERVAASVAAAHAGVARACRVLEPPQVPVGTTDAPSSSGLPAPQ